MQFTQKDIDRFWLHVDKSGTHGSWNGTPCWVWIGTCLPKGYGQFSIKHVHVYAHRFIWAVKNGEIGKGFEILHHCDNPSCVQPQHLFRGTQSDNMKDMAKKGRMYFQKHPEALPHGKNHWRSLHPENVARGENCTNAKITEQDVISIRNCTLQYRAIGKLFGISLSHVARIKKRISWKHV